MPDTPAPHLSRRLRLPLIWIVPLVAAVVAGWMLYGEWSRHGPTITIHFADGSGIEPAQTRLRYKGVTVGMVRAVVLDPDLTGVTVRVRLLESAAGLAREGAQFWIVQPRVGFSGVSGLDTLVAGVHLNVRPGDGPRTLVFRGLDQPPARTTIGPGRSFLLMTDRMGTMQPGAPVSFRDFQVGAVEAISLSNTADTVVIRIRVQEAYADLVRHNTRFWNAGGVPVEFSLFGASIQTASLSSFFTGAIGMATPDTQTEPAPEGTPFRLFRKPEDSWLQWHPKIPIVVPDIAPPEPPPATLPGIAPETEPAPVSHVEPPSPDVAS